jgi:hypothetical protein
MSASPLKKTFHHIVGIIPAKFPGNLVVHGAPPEDAGSLQMPDAFLSTVMKLRPDTENPQPECVYRQSQRLGQLLLACLVQNAAIDD